MVTGSAWRKNNRRELRHSLGRFLAIVAIVALGVGFFAGLKVAQPAMLRTGSQYVQKTELFDYRLVSTLGLTQEDADYFAGLDGVRAAEGARSVDLTAEFDGEGMTLKALTLSDAVNRPSLTAGRMPERADECLADADRFTEADLGKTLTVQAASVNDAFTQTAFTIVGLAETPLYLGAERGTTSLGGGTLNGFVLLQPEAFAMDYFTEIYLLLDGTQGTDLYSDAYDAAVDAVRPALTAALKERAQKRYDDIIDETRDALSKAQDSLSPRAFVPVPDAPMQKPRDLLLIDSGGQYLEGTTDITRTFALGPVTDEQKKHFTAVLCSMLNLANAKFLQGMTGIGLDILARGPIWDMGIDYRCGTGHGVSYLMSVHEGPNSFRWHKSPTRAEDTVQEPGMVTTDEPGVYIEGSHGIRTENELVCRKLEENEYGQFLGFETITCAPIDLDAVIPEQMSPRQRGWLNDYHAFVRETLLPLMQDDDERAWLRHATRAI